MLQITLVFIGFENLEFLRNYESNRIMIKSIHHNDTELCRVESLGKFFQLHQPLEFPRTA